jgi:hypothetical protein
MFCIKRVQECDLKGIITTQKDWAKIFPLIKKLDEWKSLPFYVAHVELAFLSTLRKTYFLKKIRKILQLK